MNNPNRRTERSEEDQVKGAAARIAREGVPMNEAKFRAEDAEAFREKVRKVSQRELSPEQVDKLIRTLKSRFDSADKWIRESVDFAAVEKRLRDNPEALFSLYKMEETGGEPQMVGIERGNKFVFEDRSAESPSGRRNLTFDEAIHQANEFGKNVRLQSPDSYERMQLRKKYDLGTSSWLQGRVVGSRQSGVVDLDQYTDGSFQRAGWRASLMV